MANLLVQEYIAFGCLTEALLQASDAAKAVALSRPDQKQQWEKVAETLAVTREMCFRLAGDGAVGKANT